VLLARTEELAKADARPAVLDALEFLARELDGEAGQLVRQRIAETAAGAAWPVGHPLGSEAM
jgi:hypothetical protein